MGLSIAPYNDDVTAPDVSWSYSGFGQFRSALAAAEDFELSKMVGFGGDRRWDTVAASLLPLLNRADDEYGYLSVAECTQMLPRLAEIVANWHTNSPDADQLQQGTDLIRVLRICIDQNVPAMFC